MQLIKGHDVIGLKVITMKDGKVVDKVEDIVYDPREHKVKALLLDEGGWLSDAKVILLENINSIGQDAVMIESGDLIKKASEVNTRVATIAKDDTYLTKTKIVTDTGTALGSISDIYFDPKTGNVDELEVSQGLQSLQSGKKTVKVANIVTVGEDATIVQDVVEQHMEKQAEEKGAQGAINRITDTMQERAPQIIDQIKTKTQELTQKAQEKTEEMKEQAQPRLDQMVNKAQESVNEAQNKAEETTNFQQGTINPNPSGSVEQQRSHTQTTHVKTGYPAPASGQYKPQGGQSEYTLSKGETVPPARGVNSSTFTLVDKSKHKKD